MICVMLLNNNLKPIFLKLISFFIYINTMSKKTS